MFLSSEPVLIPEGVGAEGVGDEYVVEGGVGFAVKGLTVLEARGIDCGARGATKGRRKVT